MPDVQIVKMHLGKNDKIASIVTSMQRETPTRVYPYLDSEKQYTRAVAIAVPKLRSKLASASLRATVDLTQCTFVVDTSEISPEELRENITSCGFTQSI